MNKNPHQLVLSRRQTLRLGLGAYGSLAALAPHFAIAHRQKLTRSTLIWKKDGENLKTGRLNITHSFHIHEAETALWHAGLIPYPDLTRLKARAQLALYTEARFILKTLNDRVPLPLTLIGAETEGRSAYVYQELALAKPPTGFVISCNFFRDSVAGQINTIDININGTIGSLKFQGHDGPKPIALT